jgi:hypothetical protein
MEGEILMQGTAAMVGTATVGSPLLSFITLGLAWGIIIFFGSKHLRPSKPENLLNAELATPSNLDVVPGAPIQQAVVTPPAHLDFLPEAPVEQVLDLLTSQEGMAAVAQATANMDFILINTSAVAPVVAAFSTHFIYGDYPGLLPMNFRMLEYSMFYSLAGLGFTCLSCQWPLYSAIGNFSADLDVFFLYNNLGTINSIVNSYAAVNPYGIDDRILNSSKLSYVNYTYFYDISWRHCQFKLVEQGYYPGSLQYALNNKYLEYCKAEPHGFVPVCTSEYRRYMAENHMSVKQYYDGFLLIPDVISYCRLVVNDLQFLNAVFNFLIPDIKLG